MAVLDVEHDKQVRRRRPRRDYPERLRPFEAYDQRFLPLLSDDPRTFDDLNHMVEDPRDRAVLARWLASAEWRALIERRRPERGTPRTYVLGREGRKQLQTA